MAKRAPLNNRPWPDNLIYDFNLGPNTSSAEAEAFIHSLSTSEKNKEFLRLRYQEGKTYADIGLSYGITASGIRQAVKYVTERYLKSCAAAAPDAVDLLSLVDDNDAGQADTPPPAADDTEKDEKSDVNAPADDAHDDAYDRNANADEARSLTPSAEAAQPKKIREELKPIITAITNTTRQRTFVYDLKMKVVLQSDNIPRGLRRDSRYIPLPDYYQIKEYDLMQDFTNSLADTDSDKSDALTVALNGLGPFKAFRSTVRNLGLGQAWVDYRYDRFVALAEEWWEKEVAPALAARSDRSSLEAAPADTPRDGASLRQPGMAEQEGAVLVVNPAALNGIALIETIRVLYRRVGPADFEEALDELRDCLCQTVAGQTSAQQGGR